MNITQELVERIAHLARLNLPEEEKVRMAAQLEEILGSMTALDKLVLEEEELPLEGANVLREDVPGQSMDTEDLVNGASETEGEYILVPAAIQGGQG